MAALAPIVARLAHAPLALCPARGSSALRALQSLFGLDIEPSSRSRPLGVVPVHGVLVRRGTGHPGLDEAFGITAYDTILSRVSEAVADSRVSEVVLDVDSPGGEVQGLLDAADAIRAASKQKPIVARANENALSAAYVLAASASRIEVARTGRVGSVGVVAMHQDLSGLLAAEGVKVELIYAGEKKVDGNPFGPLSDRARADIRASVERAYGHLVAHVAESRGRRLTAEQVKATEAGVYEGQQAVDTGLADAVFGGQSTTGAKSAASTFGHRKAWTAVARRSA